MCKLTKEEDFDLPEAQYLLSLGRRSFEQLLEQNPPAPCPTMPAPSQTETQSSSSEKPSLANEIQSLIKMGKDRNISSVPIESHPLESSNTIGQNSKNSEDLINIKGQPEKRLIIQETSDRFGLINKKNSKGVFHFVKSFDAETSDVQPTLRDIQDKIDLTFNSQQLLLRTLLIQNQQMNCQIEGLKRDFRELRKELDSRPQKTFGNLTAPSLPSDKIEILNKFSLLQYLYPSPKFEYEIEPTEPVDPIFVKERNFKIDFRIVSRATREAVHPQEPLFLEFKLYSSENPPKVIEFNTCGNAIFKGTIVKEVKNGYCCFDKVQIKEVSSHFRNGWVFLVVMPKKLTEAKFEEEQFNKIQPFILDNIIIKAKLNCVNKKKEDEPQA